MSTIRNAKVPRRGSVGVVLLAAAGLVVAGVSPTEAGLTTPSCLAKKLKEWGNLRKCQATENGKALQGKASDPGKCQTKFEKNLAKLTAQGTKAGIACRYGVNGDGTAMDYDTGLQWEQKTDDGSVHDKDNPYTWSDSVGGAFTQPSGTAFKEFLGTLNNGMSGDGSTTSGCFAGHCDWRLPAIVELAGIVDTSQGNCGGGSGPCIDQAVFGPTVFGSGCWSASTWDVVATVAWLVVFDDGLVTLAVKAEDVATVRGVRSAL